MRSVNYHQQKFYYFYDFEEPKNSVVLDFSKKILSLDQVKKLGFKDSSEFCFFLEKLNNKKASVVYLDEQEICELISDNLCYTDKTAISVSLSKSFLLGVNYSIVKVKDLSEIANLLKKIADKNNLSFNLIVFPLEIPVKLKELKCKKYLMSPFGSFEKSTISVAPFCSELVLKEIFKN